MIKVFGIGNILLTDDSIGVHVAEYIKNKIDNKYKDVEVFIGETDYYYCIDNISEGDFIIIIDSSYFNAAPGTIKEINLKDYYAYHKKMMMAHDESLPEAIFREQLENDGVILAIEGYDFGFGIGMSKEISDKFDFICSEVMTHVNKHVENMISRGEG